MLSQIIYQKLLTLPYDKLSLKQSKHGIIGIDINWSRNFLNNRTFDF